MKKNFYITGLILIILGALTFRYPVEAIMTAGFFIGCGLVASGLNYFSGWYFFRCKRFIALGLLDLIAGVMMILQPGLSAFFMPFVIGLWLFATGIASAITTMIAVSSLRSLDLRPSCKTIAIINR